jgi:hypothetical protein
MKKKHMAVCELARLGGLSKSSKKQEAARKNGMKGGRPKKGEVALWFEVKGVLSS